MSTIVPMTKNLTTLGAPDIDSAREKQRWWCSVMRIWYESKYNHKENDSNTHNDTISGTHCNTNNNTGIETDSERKLKFLLDNIFNSGIDISISWHATQKSTAYFVLFHAVTFWSILSMWDYRALVCIAQRRQ